MTDQQTLNYTRIANAIEYIKTNFKDQPNLDQVAEKINLSPFHFQRLFSEFAGTSPKKFLQYTSLEYAKTILKENQATLFETALETGLSGTGRLHDLFVNIEGMTPAEYKNGGIDLQIKYNFAESPFGKIIVASTEKGICHLAFADNEIIALQTITNQFPNAQISKCSDIIQENAVGIFTKDWTKLKQIKLHLKGTDFQLKVWEALLKIPVGQLTTYGTIAHKIENPNASRAVGTAIGSNPVAFLIPCHRVIQSSGVFGEYMWGSTRKTIIIGWEGTKTHAEIA
ncbi:methylated-DNA--[protein]-cysteine S-methyltransferase [Lacihabitans sp. LS3-19]|uniref:bifunctional helix-turn-helix domain-containing protein/methylated-DNA--[protein]-cysteine S-methyltransferase n=1 Tax=Lacihabitans sp. LS3-19 TaxID=2487335 RepID=UPI0020CD33DD|nr:methylated-DNA--[protein]-cysteine S-methyltransferase [Lacihabitans sp. LS3-19]MCP9769535.1 methylated-DNA--[protein]-cysteine S-methyltransferase [Lacihabitans sp. LS3-19]